MGSIVDDLNSLFQRTASFGQGNKKVEGTTGKQEPVQSYATPLPSLELRPQSVNRVRRQNKKAAAPSSNYSTNWAFSGNPQETVSNPGAEDPAEIVYLKQEKLNVTTTDRSEEEQAELERIELERQLWAMFESQSTDFQSKADQAQPSQQLGRISSTRSSNDLRDENGLITDVGKFLLDPNAINILEQIIRSKKVSALVTRLSLEKEIALTRLQAYLMKQPHVLSTIVLGHDGNVLTTRGITHSEASAHASWALCAYVNSRTAAEMVGSKQLDHIVLNGSMGTIFLSDFGQALLVTITATDEADAVSILLDKLDALLR